MIGETHFADRRRECDPAQVAEVPNAPAVFLVHADEGAPYLARTGVLRRRLLRLFGAGGKPSRLLNLSGVARRIEYWTSGSRLESAILFYSLARRYYPETYLKLTKLRMPAWLKLTTANPFPRSTVTSRVAGRGRFYGPFRSRASAELFDSQTLDLFQVRRCEENLEPSPSHPGCMYGEMAMCLRPCQLVVSESEYASETARLDQFLTTRGQSLLETVTHARDRASEELNFEEAARLHKRFERIEGILKLRDELVSDIDRLYGIAAAPSAAPETVTLWFMLAGRWADPVDFPLAAPGVSLDKRLRETAAQVAEPRVSAPERQEHVALLARWFYSSWCDGEWLQFESMDKLPYRRAVNAIGRIARSSHPAP